MKVVTANVKFEKKTSKPHFQYQFFIFDIPAYLQQNFHGQYHPSGYFRRANTMRDEHYRVT